MRPHFFRSILKRAARPFAKPFPLDAIFLRAGRLIASGRLEGDYLEFGVFEGRTMTSAYKAIELGFAEAEAKLAGTPVDKAGLRDIWSRMRFYGFDSFAGLPPSRGCDATGDFKPGDFACSQSRARRNIAGHGVPEARFQLVEGWYGDTLKPATAEALKLRKAALIHIDCDLYESTKEALAFCKPLLIDGAILVFNDWYCFKGNPDLGEQRAFREFCAEMRDWNAIEYQKNGAFANSFILTRKIGALI